MLASHLWAYQWNNYFTYLISSIQIITSLNESTIGEKLAANVYYRCSRYYSYKIFLLYDNLWTDWSQDFFLRRSPFRMFSFFFYHVFKKKITKHSCHEKMWRLHKEKSLTNHKNIILRHSLRKISSNDLAIIANINSHMPPRGQIQILRLFSSSSQ